MKIKYVKIFIAALVLIAAFSATAFAAVKTHVSERYGDVYYENIEIKRGDTLWTIAEEYKPSRVSTRDYIQSVKKINGLTDDLIYEDSFLIIPVECAAAD